jgi:hypothetical protein
VVHLRRRAWPRTRIFSAVASASVLALSSAACGSEAATPRPSLLSDPAAVVELSLTNLQAAATLHVHGSMGGSVDPNAVGELLGVGATGISGKLKLDGSSIVGDFDLARAAAHVTISLPSLFGSSADAIVLDGYAYARVVTPLSPAGAMYVRSRFGSVRLLPAAGSRSTDDAGDESSILGAVLAALGASGSTATMVGQDEIDQRAAYHLSEVVPEDALRRAIAAPGPLPAGSATIELAPVDYWVYDDSLQPASVRISLSSPDLGTLVVALVFTAYGRPVTIEAPAAASIEPG